MEEKYNNAGFLQTLTIPHDVLMEHILPRLPVKTLVLFKSVCKSWYFSLSSPHFAKSHLQFSSSSHNYFLFHDMCMGSVLLPYNDEEHGLKELVMLDEESSPGVNTDVMGSCNGIVCSHFNILNNGGYALWNPATHELRRINLPLLPFPKFHEFGYAPLLDDYKIVAIYKVDVGKLDIYVFSSRAGNWKQKIGALDYNYGFGIRNTNGLLVGDTLYWSSDKTHIVGFNLESEQMKAIATMECATSYLSICLYEMKGCLSLHCMGDDNSSDVWILKRQGDSNIWEKIFSIPHLMHLMGFSITGNCLMQYIRSHAR